MAFFLAFVIGIVAGLRAMTAPAAVSWAARLGLLDLGGTWLSFLGHPATPWVFTLAAAAEFVTDQLPATPSRKVPVQFGVRIAMGAFCGAAIGAKGGNMAIGAAAGVVGAVAGTLGGAEARARLAARFGRDRPAAIIEDVVALGGAALVVAMLR